MITAPAQNVVEKAPSTVATEEALFESIQLGSLSCQFAPMETFLALCRRWLKVSAFHHVITLNPEMVMLAAKDPIFAAAGRSAELRVPDGAGLVWARWFIRSQFWSLLPSLLAFPFVHVERITGVEALLSLAELCAKEQKSVYLLGGTPGQVGRTAAMLAKRHPGLTIHTSRDHVFDSNGPIDIIADIRDKHPDVLFVAYGARKQTVWIEQFRHNLPSVRIALGVGGAFAILSEDTPRAPRLLQRLNLEWLWRLILEPERLPRIWQATVAFPRLISRQKASTVAKG